MDTEDVLSPNLYFNHSKPIEEGSYERKWLEKLNIDNLKKDVIETLKIELSLINKLIGIRANSIKESKDGKLSLHQKFRWSVRNVLAETNNESKINCILTELADLLTELSLIESPNNPLYKPELIGKMNKKSGVDDKVYFYNQ